METVSASLGGNKLARWALIPVTIRDSADFTTQRADHQRRRVMVWCLVKFYEAVIVRGWAAIIHNIQSVAQGCVLQHENVTMLTSVTSSAVSPDYLLLAERTNQDNQHILHCQRIPGDVPDLLDGPP
jgi:hypothetical protein